MKSDKNTADQRLDQHHGDDLISPTAIYHEFDEVIVGAVRMEGYNFLVYEFASEQGFMWARAYLDTISTVSIFGPFRSADDRSEIDAPDLYAAVLAYFGRRFSRVERLGEAGHEVVWQGDSQ